MVRAWKFPGRRRAAWMRLVVTLVTLGLIPGCFKSWSSHTSVGIGDGSELSADEELSAHEVAYDYYRRAVENTDHPHISSMEVEVPAVPPPLTALNPEADERVEVTLHDVMQLALRETNLIRQLDDQSGASVAGGVTVREVTAYDPAISESRIESELGRAFDSTMAVNLFWSGTRQQINNNVQGGQLVAPGFIFKQDTFGGIAGRLTGLSGAGNIFSLRKPLATGGSILLTGNVDYDLPNTDGRFFNSGINSQVGIAFTQPLLRGSGADVTRAAIVIARIDSDSTLWDFKRALGDYIRDVEVSYWRLFQAKIDLWAIDKGIEVSAQIVRRLELQEQRRTANPADLAESKVQLARFKRQRNETLKDLVERERNLRAIIGLPPSDGKRLVPVDEPGVAPIVYDWDGIIQEAITYDPLIQILKLDVARTRQQLLRARNLMLPQLDFFVQKQYFGLGNHVHDSFAQLTDGSFNSWTVGLQFQTTLGYRQETATYHAAVLQLAKSKELVRNRGRELLHTLSSLYASLAPAFKDYELSAELTQIAQERLEIQREQYEKSEIDISRLLDGVQVYAGALQQQWQEKVEYQISMAGLEAAKGTIMRYNNIHVHEGAWSENAYPQAQRQLRDRERAIPNNHHPIPGPPLELNLRHHQVHSPAGPYTAEPPEVDHVGPFIHGSATAVAADGAAGEERAASVTPEDRDVKWADGP